MRYISCIVAAAALAASVGGCAYRTSYVVAPDDYTYTPTYYRSGYYYPTTSYYSYPSSTYYASKYDYYRNYNGSLHPPGQDY
jgi:hypothetical protein